MHKRKFITIFLMLACTLLAVVGNWEYWQRALGSRPTRPSFSQDIRTPSVATRSEEPVRAPEKVPDELSELTLVAQRLTERLTPAPQPITATGAGISHFKHPLELAGGVRFADLVKEVLENRDRSAGGPEPLMPTGQATADPAEQAAHREHVRLMQAQVTAIMNGSKWSLCVIDGHRLKTGDVFPGTGYAVEKITDHGVIFRRGEKTLQKTLRGIGGS